MPAERNTNGSDAARFTAKRLHMEALPSSDYYLYTMIREQLDLDSLRQTFIVGLRLTYSIGHDPNLRPILLNILGEVRETNLDEFLKRKQRDGGQPTYTKFDWTVRI